MRSSIPNKFPKVISYQLGKWIFSKEIEKTTIYTTVKVCYSDGSIKEHDFRLETDEIKEEKALKVAELVLKEMVDVLQQEQSKQILFQSYDNTEEQVKLTTDKNQYVYKKDEQGSVLKKEKDGSWTVVNHLEKSFDCLVLKIDNTFRKAINKKERFLLPKKMNLANHLLELSKAQGGLPNIGNSCYQNATFQALRFLPNRNVLFENRRPIKNWDEANKRGHYLSQQIKELFERLDRGEDIRRSEISKILKGLQKGELKEPQGAELLRFWSAEGTQEDAAEFLEIVYDLVFRPNTFTIARDKSYEKSEQEIRNWPNVLEHSRESSYIYRMPLEKKNNSLQKIFAQQHLVDEVDEYDGVQRKVKSRSYGLAKDYIPNILPIQLGRFIIEKNEGKVKLSKCFTQVIPDPIIKVSVKDDKGNIIEEKTYAHISTIVHLGSSLKRGHYITYAKTNIKGRVVWVECNDSSIKEVEYQDIESNLTRNGYIHFYILVS